MPRPMPRRMPALLSLVIVLAVLLAAPARAAEDDPALLAFSLGWFDLIDEDDQAGDFRLEYRAGTRWLGFLKPWAGLEVTSDGAFYPQVGGLMDLYFGRRWVLTPSLGLGAYIEGGGKDLGGEIAFRPQLELSYRFDDRTRLGFYFSHITNFGLHSDNPGTEVIGLTYQRPLPLLFQ